MPRAACSLPFETSGPGLDPTSARPHLRGLLHHQVHRFGHGSGDLPVDHRGARRPAVGQRQYASRRRLQFTLPLQREDTTDRTRRAGGMKLLPGYQSVPKLPTTRRQATRHKIVMPLRIAAVPPALPPEHWVAGANTMRSVLALCLLIALSASANAAKVHHSKPKRATCAQLNRRRFPRASPFPAGLTHRRGIGWTAFTAERTDAEATFRARAATEAVNLTSMVAHRCDDADHSAIGIAAAYSLCAKSFRRVLDLGQEDIVQRDQNEAACQKLDNSRRSGYRQGSVVRAPVRAHLDLL